MGEWFQFDCSRCGYQAEVSGGPSRGMLDEVHTAICHTCDPPRLVDARRQRGDYGKTRDGGSYSCPLARERRHEVTLWTHPGPCPRCGHAMLRGRLAAMWD